MQNKKSPYFLPALIAAGVLIVCDQVTKWWVVERLLFITDLPKDFWSWLITRQPGPYLYTGPETFRQIEVTGFFNLTMVWNRGISFGMFDGLGAHGPWLLMTLAVLIAGGMTFWLRMVDRRLLATGLCLIIAGALGNVIDRWRFGAVADFVDLHVAGWHWPAFNLADSIIVIGAGLVILDSLLTPEPQPEEKT